MFEVVNKKINFNNGESKNYKVFRIEPDNDSFDNICSYVEDKINKENLYENGGTLNYSGLTFHSDVLFIAAIDKIPIGYVSIVTNGDSYYVFQIAIKKEYQQKGIGTALMNQVIDMADSDGMEVTANVMDYNTNSKKMFTSLGFEKIGYSSKGDGFYRFSQNNKCNRTK